MSVIILLLSISLGVALCFLGAFIWAVKTDQYEDDKGPSIRMLFDDELKKSVEDQNLSKEQ
ncbi:MAG: cbb3-type cytochrome oxidase assembly protein CcoS [Flavobacteriales bacterium]|nr:cbb3-type cytochrome oxidase assembly protein CcoS [Flavobacteriales bacterium]